MIKNATIYRIATPDAILLRQQMEDAMDAARFVPTSGTQDKAVGFVEPRGEAHGALVETVGGDAYFRVMKLMIESKSVPGSVVRSNAQAAADMIEAETGRKPGKREMKTLREDALHELLPHAFARQSAVWIWINIGSWLMVIGSTSQRQIDEAVTALVRTFAGLQLLRVQTKVTPQSAMAQWLRSGDHPEDWPEGFNVERECELKSGGEEKSVVKFSRHNLATDEVRKHITEGKLPTRLAISWEGRVGFVLTESMQLKKIAFLEGVFNDRADDGDSGFDTDVALTTGELGKLIPALVMALGGEVVMGGA